jgi:hypothetical protein
MSPDKDVCRACFQQRFHLLNKYDSAFGLSMEDFDRAFASGYIMCRTVCYGSFCARVSIDGFEELFAMCPFATEHVISQEKKDE